MTKRRLGDLLREEAQESPDSESKAVQEADTPLPKMELPDQTKEPSSVDEAVALPKHTSLTKADLETTVIELQEVLQAAHSKENSLQQQIADLQLGLQEQKTLVQKLQTTLEQGSQLQAELEQAKKVILQLSETNSKTAQEASTPKKGKKDSHSQKLSLKKLPQHSIQPELPQEESFEQNVGWFD